ncbi:extracellular solute-binding protein [Paenibacillus lignilyticus]|uniref:Extracellular solute-binding protein n=1 Tax=Paenibacillus lignilyticus TaxID=1172615 RepID=A0ABS5C9V1_9BACL|nr:extracellular solute-binding protein [Paenibacillus lignilyticus]MBP3962718.1 extracellular solute-binding protein [Paenibacillus lignilyticus]
MRKASVRKVLGVMLSVFMIISAAAGCSNNNNNTAGDSTQQASESNGAANTEGNTAAQAGDMSALPDAEFSVMLGWNVPQLASQDAPVVKQVYDKTKVRLNLESPPANVDEKLNIMLASGEMTDAIVINNPSMAQKFIDAGYVIPLDELFDKYGGQIKENLNSVWGQLKNEDGKIYKIPSGYILPGADRMLETGYSFQFLTNVLEAKGWYKPQTFDELTALLKEVKEKYPQYIPMSLALGTESFFTNMVKTLAGAEGVRLYNDYVWTPDDKLIYKYKDAGIRDSLKWLNQLYQQGLLDEESAVQNIDGFKAKMASEKVFSSIGSWFDNMYEANSIFTQDKKPFRFKYFLLKGNPEVAKTTYDAYGANYDSGVYISSKMKDPERFMQFVNYLNTQEGNLLQKGVVNFDGEDKDGYDYFITEEEGKKYIKSTTFQVNGWQNDELFASKRGLNTFGFLTFSTDMNDHPSFTYQMSRKELDFSMWWDDETKRANEGYGEKGTDWIEEGRSTGWDYTDIAGLNFKPESAEYIATTKVNQLSYNTIVKLILSASDAEFDKGYDEFLKKADDMGIGQAEAAMNQMYQDRKAEWKQ